MHGDSARATRKADVHSNSLVCATPGRQHWRKAFSDYAPFCFLLPDESQIIRMFRSVSIVQDMLSNLCDSLVFSILRPRTRNLEMTFEAKRQLLLQQIRCAPVKVTDELRTQWSRKR
jgi:hypothetical protein